MTYVKVEENKSTGKGGVLGNGVRVGGEERECTLVEAGFVVVMVGTGLGGRVVGDGTNQGQGENVPLLPRGIIGGAGFPPYFIPQSHLSLEFSETEWRD